MARKHVKRLGIGLVGLIFLLILSAIIIAGFFQQAVGKKLISEINKNLKTELRVGSFDLSLLRSFPNATVRLQDVVVLGAFGEGLVEAKEMSFHFHLLSLFGSQVKVHSLSIKNGALNIHIDRKGKQNYDIFKPTKDKEGGEFSIALKKATLEKIELAYRDELLRQEMLIQVESADFSGEFSDKQFALTSKAKLASNFIDLDNLRYFAGKKWSYDARLFVDLLRGKYDFEDVKVKVEENNFNVNGYVQSQKNFSDFDLTVTTEDANLESVIAFLPEQYLKTLSDFTSSGTFRFGATVKGKLSAAERPAIDLDFSLDNGKLISPRLKEPFKDVSFHAAFTNGNRRSQQTSLFEVSNFKGYLNRELIQMNLRVENTDNPFVDFQANGALPIGYFYGLFNNPSITGGEGELEVKNLSLKGAYADMTNIHRINAVSMSGEIEFDDVALEVNKEKMLIDRGTLRFQDNLLTVDNLELEGAGCEIMLTGMVGNLLPVLFADSLNSKNAELAFKATLQSPVMDVARLVKLTDVPVKEGVVEVEVFDSLKVKNNQQRQRFTDLLKGTFNAGIDEFNYGKIEGKAFNGKLEFDNGQMRILGSTQAMRGTFDLDGTMFFEAAPRLEAKLSAAAIDVKDFFRQTNNAGQDYLRSENIEGAMNAKMLIHAFWDSTGTFLGDKLHVWAGVSIMNGELKGFKMLEEFSTYAKIKDLRDVRFTQMQNWLEVKNRTFYLPVMFIQNNAMNMTLCGEQTFDDRIDYNIKVNAGQILAQKFKKHNPNLEPIEAKQHGFFNLYFNVSGTLDKYNYETNKKEVKRKFERSEQQKRLIKLVMEKAFGESLDFLNEPAAWLDAGESARPADDIEHIEGF
jgi:hypothetical protein